MPTTDKPKGDSNDPFGWAKPIRERMAERDETSLPPADPPKPSSKSAKKAPPKKTTSSPVPKAKSSRADPPPITVKRVGRGRTIAETYYSEASDSALPTQRLPTNAEAALATEPSVPIPPAPVDPDPAVRGTDLTPVPRRRDRSRKVAAPQVPTKQAAQPVSQPPPSEGLPVPPLSAGERDHDGVPPTYDDGVAWLLAGVRRHRPPVIVGLIFSWTGAWIAFWGAIVGAAWGALLGLGLTGRALPIFTSFGGGQAVSALSVVTGVVLGTVGGFVAFLLFLIAEHPLAFVGSFVAGVILTAVLVAGSASYERLSLRIRGYRRLSRDEVRRVAPQVKSAADAMDLPALPRFAMADQVIPNAWTHMRTVVLTKGLLQTLDDDELRAVLVHELNHWRNGDAVGLHCVWAASWPVTLVYNLGVVISGGGKSNDQTGVQVKVSSGLRWIVAWFIAWPAWVITRVMIAPMMAASQRRYEYEADAAAYQVGLGPQLISALRKIGAFESGRTGWEAAMTASHPPVELRIEALQPPKPDDWEYQEEELRGPSRREMGRIFGSLAHPSRS